MKTNTMTLPLVIATASLAFVLSPSVGLANTSAKSKAHQAEVVRQPVRQSNPAKAETVCYHNQVGNSDSDIQWAPVGKPPNWVEP